MPIGKHPEAIASRKTNGPASATTDGNTATSLAGKMYCSSFPVSPERLEELAGQLGSDCPFFLHESAMMMEGRGDLLSPVNVSLKGFYLVLLFPEIHISTAEAYGAVSPHYPDVPLRHLIETPVDRWNGMVKNDFEESVFQKHPLLKELKDSLYSSGAKFASMSGSGSSLFGIFDSAPHLPVEIQKYVIWMGPA